MATMILDEYVERQVLKQRAEDGDDRYDEVWEGVYMMMSLPNNEHQELVAGLTHALYEVVHIAKLGRVLPGCNVSDRDLDWKFNYRCPDFAVYLNGTSAVDRDTYWQGGPDFAIEILSPGDESRRKLPFYASVGTREVLLIDRNPWQLELYKLEGDGMRLAERTDLLTGTRITSMVLPLTFMLEADEDRPAIVAAHTTTDRTWRI